MYTPESEMLESRPTRTVWGGLSGGGRLAVEDFAAAWGTATLGTAVGATAAGAAAGGAGAAVWQPSTATTSAVQAVRPMGSMATPRGGRALPIDRGAGPSGRRAALVKIA